MSFEGQTELRGQESTGSSSGGGFVVEEEMEARRSGEQQQQKQKQKHRSRDKKEAIRTERYRVGNKNGRPREGSEGGSGRPTLPPYCTVPGLLCSWSLSSQLSLQSKIRNAPMATPEVSWARASAMLGED
jgi:hypothetical protein